MVKKVVIVGLVLVFIVVGFAAVGLMAISSNLPKLITVADYKPRLVSEVYARGGEKIGEFFREKRILVPYDEIPTQLINAFMAAEDSDFFQHQGVNPVAIFRAFFANLRAGRKVQGGSTITQQVAKSLLLSPEKTYLRKIREVMLAYRMEENLKKEDILYLYLNQIYLGHGAYGVGMAAQIYFRKPVSELTLSEMTLVAGLPQAPSRYSPVFHPDRAKARQRYVLSRMASEKMITQEVADAAVSEPVTVYKQEDYKKIAPHYLETVRQMLVKDLGEDLVLDDGLKVYTGLDLQRQLAAQEAVHKGLRDLDKRQGYRGAKKNIASDEEIHAFLLQSRNNLMDSKSPERVVRPDGTTPDKPPIDLVPKVNEKGEIIPNFPDYLKIADIVDAIVTKIDDKWGLVYVRFAESTGIIDIEDMKWARTPDPLVRSGTADIKKPSDALKIGDVIEVKIAGTKFYSERINNQLREMKQNYYEKMRKRKVEDILKFEIPEDLPQFNEYLYVKLEQEPIAEASLISIGQSSQEILAMVGGYDFSKSQFNRSIQALRQTGSAFKAIVYAAALDKDYTAATAIIDAPVVYEEEQIIDEGQETEEVVTKKWKPLNHSKSFGGDILFRNALIQSKNVPTVKVLQDIGVKWAATYARRLGIFSPLNLDYTLGLGSSAVTLYEMTKVFSTFGRMGRRVRPLIIKKVLAQDGAELLGEKTLDERFTSEMEPIETEFEEKRVAFLEGKPQEVDEKSGVVPGTEAENEKNKDEAKDKDVEKLLAAAGVDPSAEPAIEEDKSPEDDDADSQADGDPSVAKKKKTPNIYFKDPDQLISPTTAYLITNILKGAVFERHGTGAGARALGRPVAAKTGTTNGYYDGWFVGYTPHIATGVWVGFDNEQSLGKGEVGGRAALPIWVDYMKAAHQDLPEAAFPVPSDIVFANIDNDSGKIASARTKVVVRQAFLEGTEPHRRGETSEQHIKDGNPSPSPDGNDEDDEEDDEDLDGFYKQDLTE